MDFTIITPSYNYGHFIAECLESVAAQRDVEFEHLVMDGCSSDNTADVVARYPHASFFQEPDDGMSDAINKGFLRAKGAWVMWLNADDRLKAGALAAVKEFTASNPNVDVIFGGWDFIASNGDWIRTMTLFPFRRRMLVYLGCYLGSTATWLKRTSVIDQGHLLNPRFRYVMDGEYYARLAAQGKRFAYYPCVLADFRIHGQNLSFKNEKAKSVDECLALQYQYSEARAIRRAYGATWFKDENLNGVVDTILQIFYRLLKPLLKLCYKHKLVRSLRQ
jgi:glycosyltransferase involved in cell wall biosynthesis